MFIGTICVYRYSANSCQKKYRETRDEISKTGAGLTGDEETGADSIHGMFLS